jgi:hypothetical protein
MIEYIKTIVRELNTGDAQKNDWLSWSGNQLSHCLIGLIFSFLLILIGLESTIASISVILAYVFLKELPDWCKIKTWAAARDSLQDSLFVASGCFLSYSINSKNLFMFLMVLMITICFLGIGVYQRISVEKGQGKKDE